MLQREDILRLTNNGEDVFRHYIKHKWKEGVNFKNPFYNDTNPSFNIFRDRDSGVYRMRDGGDESYRGDCFALVGFVYSLDSNNKLNFVDIMRLINRDMSLGLNDSMDNYSPPPMTKSIEKFTITPTHHKDMKVEQKNIPYKITPQPFRESDTSFWAKYGIDKRTLERYNVSSAAEFSSINKDNKPYRFRSTMNEPMFGYNGDGFVKIYRPHSAAKFLFGGKCKGVYCFRLSQLPSKGDMVFITGGEKDVLSLAAKGFNAITFNSETATIPEYIIESLYHRFKHIIVLYDMDATGKKKAAIIIKKFSKYDLKYLALPLRGSDVEKDVSDYFRIGYTRRDLINLFLVILDKMYQTSMTMLSSCEIDCDTPLESEESIISLSGVSVGAGGNLLGITGGEGTGKSSYVASLVSGAISYDTSNIDTLGAIIAANKSRKAVLLYDTEQSSKQLRKNRNNILRRANISVAPDEFKTFSLTALPRKERLKIIMQSMDRYHYEYDGIHLVVIDGIADLVKCANDEAESILVVEELYRLATIHNTCIVVVLHFVPNGLKLRGHLGSEIQRKAAAILSVERDKNPAVSVVKALKVRDGSALDVPLIQFSWNDEMSMHTFIGAKSEKARVQRKRHDLKKLSEDIFMYVNEYTYGNLCSIIQQMTGISERTAADYVKDMVQENMIIKDATTKYYRLNYGNKR